MTFRLLAFILVASSSFAQIINGGGGSTTISTYTVARLPATGTTNQIVVVTDSYTPGSCTAGGSATPSYSFCTWNGSGWQSMGASAGIGASIGPYVTSTIGSSPMTISEATHGQGTAPVAFCQDNSSPSIISSCGASDSSGNLTITWASSYTLTKVIVIGSTGISNFVYVGVGAGLPATCVVGNQAFVTDATAGLNMYGATSAGPPCVWSAPASSANITGPVNIATSVTTPTINVHSESITNSVSSVFTVAPASTGSGGTYTIPNGGGTFAMGGSGAAGATQSLGGATVGGATTAYIAPGQSSVGATAPNRLWISTVPCRLQSLYVVTSGSQPTGGALVFTLLDEGTNPLSLAGTSTTLTVTVATSAIAEIVSDTTHTYALAAGHMLTLQAANASSSTSASIAGWGVACQ